MDFITIITRIYYKNFKLISQYFENELIIETKRDQHCYQHNRKPTMVKFLINDKFQIQKD